MSDTFEMDRNLPDLMDDFDFGAFLNLPSDDDDQGGEDGVAVPQSVSTCKENSDTSLPAYVVPESPIGTSYCDPRRPLHREECCHKVGLPGSVIGQELPRANGPVDPTIIDTLTKSPSYECSCIACLSVGALKDWPDRGVSCRFLDCSYFAEGHSDHILHERSHFHKAGNEAFCCVEQVCPFTSKRWPDLVRHYTVKHCTSPKKFRYPCPVLWCKYSGNNGFARKDKLKSHYKNIHEGKPGPVKAGRVIKPATLKPQASPGGSADRQKD